MFERELEEQAKGLCSTCMMFDPCRQLVDRLERRPPSDDDGVWAGETPRERRARRRRERLRSLETGH